MNLETEIYCSPWCGANCTKAAYNQAVKDSSALAKEMGSKWRPRVWENMGWHWSIVSGPIEISYSKTGSSYSCLISADDNIGGYGAWIPRDCSDATARGALRKALKAVRAHRDRIIEATAQAEEAAR